MNDLRNDPDADPRPTMQETFANIREKFGAYFDAIPDVDAFVREQRGGGDRDLPTADQRHADELAELRERLEAIEAALHSQANMLQVLWLERETRGPRP